jgi:hypothetical protein
MGRFEIQETKFWRKGQTKMKGTLSLTIVPFVQCIDGPPRSVKERPSSNVAPGFC